jgi:hypothetical protein
MGFAGLSMDATKVLTQVAGLPNIKLAAAADAKRTAALDRFSADFGAETYESIEKLCQSPNVDQSISPRRRNCTPSMQSSQRGIASMSSSKSRWL